MIISNSNSISNETHAILLELLRRIYGSDAAIRDVNVVNQHHDYAALLITIENPSLKLAVKLAGREAPYSYPFDRTAYWHRLVAERTPIPMPEVIAVDVSYRDYPWRYLIKTFIPGEEWAAVHPKLQTSDLRKAYEQIGKAVAELHSITFEAFSGVADDTTTTPDFYDAFVERINTSIRSEGLKQEFLNLVDGNRGLFTRVTQACLCHEDLHPYNILFQQSPGEWRLATILDFDKAWAGHHEIDLAKLDLWDGMTGDGFWEGYTELMTVDDGYVERRPFYQLWWCLEYAANTPKHLADTRRLCEVLNFPIIERFGEQ